MLFTKSIAKFSSAANVKNFAVVGAGQMGTGIAIVANKIGGLNVKIVDSTEKALSGSRKFTESWCDKEIAKNRMTSEEKHQMLSRFSYFTKLEDLNDADFVVEAVTEKFEVKKNIFTTLDQITKPDTILASNTSSISLTKIAATTKRPEKVIGMHFMNPVPVMKLIEIIKGLQTSDETLQTTLDLSHKLGKTTVLANDIPGFILNRTLMPYINEAVYALFEGVATVADIDQAMKLGTNVPMGPLTLADFIGLDTCLLIMQVLHTELGDSKYRPCPLLVNYVNAGYLGKKSGRGFYKY
ncbi:3-hydroxyacyl-CoA dehydrogenase (macronuclear) [Tetrahymena thermophila SB210]|uniref:3-hydroxyacyl-CoA dehydrogenase n=1 Tax=Tetrahymena thermophila (strain SB210) TaxID=312017 RepID=Q23TB8_TETTS|nr:3-hydroxyacyl-CoA dehydrogenase [Tetrahymena thermophila SB210]EAR99788.1 3-hydroxyacyl-CoA dehydrogenase [Tetrahymena thermophila SB210]|eukprot:XP_001020033.1 3-hydroxyacyl-CoA dehydrogenase [Tetrahymena thermophila SB210]